MDLVTTQLLLSSVSHTQVAKAWWHVEEAPALEQRQERPLSEHS